MHTDLFFQGNHTSGYLFLFDKKTHKVLSDPFFRRTKQKFFPDFVKNHGFTLTIFHPECIIWQIESLHLLPLHKCKKIKPMKTKHEIVYNWLPRYTGMALDKLGDHILL